MIWLFPDNYPCRAQTAGADVMPEISRQLIVTFSKNEIRDILSDRARALVLKRKDVNRVELQQVAHVEGEAAVTLIVGNKDIEVSVRDHLITARDKLLEEAQKLADYIDGLAPIDPKVFRVPKVKK
jgi:hypothetical protein